MRQSILKKRTDKAYNIWHFYSISTFSIIELSFIQIGQSGTLEGFSWTYIIIFLNICMTEIECQVNQSKKASYQLAKFHYHLSNTIPDLFLNGQTPIFSPGDRLLRSKKGIRNMTYYYADHCSEGVSSLDAEAILCSAKKLYISSQCVRVNGNSFRKAKDYKVPYLPVYGRFQEIIEFQLIDKNENGSQLKSSIKTKSPSTIKAKEIDDETLQTKQPIKIKLPNNFQLFVIHHCQTDSKEEVKHMRWESFIQRYRFVEENQGEQTKHKIYYSLMLNYEEEEGMLNYFSPQNRLYEHFIADYLVQTENGLQNLNRMQGYLLLSKDRVDKKMKELSDPSYQDFHKRWLKLPSEYYKQFTTLKKHVMSYYNSIHPQPKHPEHILNNLVCRYMHAKDYNYKQTLQSVMEYLKWEKEMAETYTLNMFAEFHKLDFFTYLGQDFEGRNVLLNRSAHLKVDQIKNVEDYCNYYIYYLEIWLQKKWKGYSDQYTIIADLQGLSSQNFKLSITKRNLGDCLKYCPERQHKLIAINVSTFATFVWGILKPLLPKRTVSKLSIVGSDKNQMLEALTKEMDVTIIPEYLGGKNTKIFSDDFQDQTDPLQI